MFLAGDAAQSTCRSAARAHGWANGLFRAGRDALLSTDAKYLAPVRPYGGRIVSAVVPSLPWAEVERR